jgi:serine/threonine-protein kinase
LLIGIFIVFVVLILLFSFIYKYLLKDMFDPTEDRISVPNFVGQNVDSVQNNEAYLEYYDFEVVYETNDTFEEGYVISQIPAADRQVVMTEDGISVELHVSSGAEKVYMPSIVNMDYRKAKIMLDNLKLNLEISLESVPDEDITVGYVISQLPEEGAQLVKGGTVYITYSSGPEIKTTEVPEVVSCSESQAISRLQSRDLSYSVQYVDDEAPKGTVIFQSIEPGKRVQIKTSVLIQVSNGPQIVEPDPPVVEPDPVTPPDEPDPVPPEPVDPEPTPVTPDTPSDNGGGQENGGA